MKQEEFFDLADEMERECGDWENSEGMSKESLDSLIAKVEQMEREKHSRAKPERPRSRFRLKKRYLVVLAAALVLLMGTGVVGDRVWIAESDHLERETEVTTKIDNEEKGDILLEEETIYQEIAEKLGIATMRLGHMPKGMKLDSYVIMEETGWASINYLYKEKLISVQMTKLSNESSSNVQWDGESRKIENAVNEYGHEIEAYCVDEESGNYGASVTYGNGYYNLFGSFEEEKEFLDILCKIYFKNV